MTVTDISFAADAPPPSPVLIERVEPSLGCGRYTVKREVGDVLDVTADIFREGHDKLAAVVRYRPWDEEAWSETPMRFIDNDRWGASFPLGRNTRYRYQVEAFPDEFETWHDEIVKKRDAGLDVAVEIREGEIMLGQMADRAEGEDRRLLREASEAAETAASQREAIDRMLASEVVAAAHRNRSREGAARSAEFTVTVDRVRARYASWYEMFPRSAGTDPHKSGTFRDVEIHLPRIQAMGFDVLYFTPVHPIGTTNRKGKNNTLNPEPDDPGVPYAIGSPEGGHDAIEPGLGTEDDFRRLVAKAADHGLEIALDIAFQASPDHPWAREHPEWFNRRPDGSIKYAENPPKKYEDIYPLNFQNSDWQGLWNELKRVILHWVDLGVKTFRVDNPHTKPVQFWERLIGQVMIDEPEAIFFAEAFTRPAMMQTLGKIGFQQSYTYFTWRNAKWEVEEYLREVSGAAAAYFRPNFFVNTPDILTEFLQYGGPTAFRLRAALAATASPSWGVYSGYELYEHVARPGAEEYLDNEKYQYRPRDWAAYEKGGAKEGESLAPYLTRLNEIRRAHPALHRLRNLTMHSAEDPSTIVFSKRREVDGRDDTVIVVINLDPHSTRESWIHLNMPALGLRWDEGFLAHDLVTGASWHWGEHAFVRLGRDGEPAHILQVRSL
jgi:starch synthase (maltosyl-transferring)